ncbi:hypothetical protein SLA2020_325050 [Shorea laevis]
MRRLGFGEKWRLWIKECLQTASASILVNGSPMDEFKMEKGLRQGDLIASFLFLIVDEGLNVLIESAVSKELFQGIPVGSDGLNISHLQFVDDTVIMGKANSGNIKAVKGILRWFELVSGLKINLTKVSYTHAMFPMNEGEWRLLISIANLDCSPSLTSGCQLVTLCVEESLGFQLLTTLIKSWQSGKRKACRLVAELHC